MRAWDSTTGTLKSSSAVERIFRISVAACFIGHGAFGFITKAAWVPYFSIVGIPEELAWQLMPIVGAIDVTTGILILFFPTRAVLYWAFAWTLWTALLRPLSGESWFEFFERAGNYGVPLAWIMAVGFSVSWTKRLPTSWTSLPEITWQRVAWVLRITTAALLVGHAGFGLLLQKEILATHYAAFAGSTSPEIVPWVGAFEFLLAALVLLKPSPALLIGVCLWKVSTELLYPMTGSPFWEFIERFGSYMAPIALAVILATTSTRQSPLQPASTG